MLLPGPHVSTNQPVNSDHLLFHQLQPLERAGGKAHDFEEPSFHFHSTQSTDISWRRVCDTLKLMWEFVQSKKCTASHPLWCTWEAPSYGVTSRCPTQSCTYKTLTVLVPNILIKTTFFSKIREIINSFVFLKILKTFFLKMWWFFKKGEIFSSQKSVQHYHFFLSKHHFILLK